MVRSELKRETLVRNIKRAINRASNKNLPVTIKEVYAFGGILRGKEKAHDFDAIFLYDQTPEQESKWRWFYSCFGQGINETITHPMQNIKINTNDVRKKIYTLLRPYYEQGIFLRDAVKLTPVAEKLNILCIEPSWAGCFSWTDVFYNPYGLFLPRIDKVLRSLLCRGMKGIQVFFKNYESFRDGAIWPAKNYRLAWSPENPDVEENLKMQQEEKIDYLKNELKNFTEQIVQLKEDFSKVLNDLAEFTQNMNIKLNFEGLTSKHADVHYSENEPHNQLRLKCEQARKEMRAYNTEIKLLKNMLDCARTLQKRIDDPFYANHTPEDLITDWTIRNTPKSDVKEADIRKILKTLGLPEHHVVTIKRVGYTYYELEPNETKRKELLKQAETAEKERKLTFKLRKIVRKIQPNATVYVRLTNEEKLVNLSIYCELTKDEKTNELFIKEWKKRGLETTRSQWRLYASKNFELTGKETLRN